MKKEKLKKTASSRDAVYNLDLGSLFYSKSIPYIGGLSKGVGILFGIIFLFIVVIVVIIMTSLIVNAIRKSPVKIDWDNKIHIESGQSK